MYRNMEEFYSENPARRSSGEADYGCWWIDGKPRPYYRLSSAYYRVTYIHATGEVYAVQLGGTGGHSGQVEVLGVVPPDDHRIYYQTLDRLLEGWAEVTRRPLSWVRDRLNKAKPGRFISRQELGRVRPNEDIGKQWECWAIVWRGTIGIACPDKGIVLDNNDGRSLCLEHAKERGYKEGASNANQTTKP